MGFVGFTIVIPLKLSFVDTWQIYGALLVAMGAVSLLGSLMFWSIVCVILGPPTRLHFAVAHYADMEQTRRARLGQTRTLC